jgi:hypothetical protein
VKQDEICASFYTSINEAAVKLGLHLGRDAELEFGLDAVPAASTAVPSALNRRLEVGRNTCILQCMSTLSP